MAEKRHWKSSAGLSTLGTLEEPANADARRRIAAPIVAILLLLAVLWLALRPGSETLDVYRAVSDIEIADPALLSCIRETAETHGWTEAGQFTSLRCNNPTGGGIERLEGIEHFVVLRELNLAFNILEDVSALASLARLTDLQLSHNRIRSLPVIASATSLKRLELNHNQIDSLAWLTAEHFLVLEYLSIAHNRIGDATPLRVLTDLRELDIRSNRLRELGSVLELRKLDVLDVGGNYVSDLAGIDALGALRHARRADSLCVVRRLFLDRNELSEISGVQALHELEQLGVGYNPITSISSLSELLRLRRLDLRYTAIDDLEPLLTLGDIEQLDVSGISGLDCAAIDKAIKEFGASAVLFDQDCPANSPDD